MNEVKKSNVEGKILQLARAFRELNSRPLAPEASIMLLEPLSRSTAFK